MTDQLRQLRLDTQAIVIGYAMSRLDGKYLKLRNCQTWKQAFAEVSDALAVRPASVKNLRDEFDPVHTNSRKGWHRRPLRKQRQRVVEELCEISDAGLCEIVNRILQRDEEPIIDAIDTLANVGRVTHNVAERLLTGRQAEEFFVDHSRQIADVRKEDLLDCRLMARGYDFGIKDQPETAIEIKGMGERRGQILFTDREWSEAECRGENYWLVVVGNLRSRPKAVLVRDPHSSLQAACDYRTSITVSWRSSFVIG